MEDDYTYFNSDFNFILLCGLPGVGKTYFSHLLKFILEKHNYSCKNQVFLFNFDEFLLNDRDIYSENIQSVLTQLESLSIKKENFDFTKYGKKRREFILSIQDKIQNEIVPYYIGGKLFKTKCFFIIDDNFYLKSMRKPFFKLSNFINDAYKISSVYLEIHLKANLDYCMANNLKREGLYRIPGEVFDKITNNFEWDSLHDNLKLDIEILNESTLNELVLNENLLMLKILKKIKDNLELIRNLYYLKKNDNKKIDKKKNKALFIDLLETRLRKSIGDHIKSNEISNNDTCKKFVMIKKNFMELIKSFTSKTNEKEISQSTCNKKLSNHKNKNSENLLSQYLGISDMLTIEISISKIKQFDYSNFSENLLDDILIIFKSLLKFY